MIVRGHTGVRKIEQRLAAIARFVWAVWSIGAVLVTLLAEGCTPSATPVRPTATAAIVVHAEPALLQVAVRPAGATVLVNAQPYGVTPLTLSLAPGQYVVRVEKSGYQALEKTLVLPSGGQARVDGSLVDVTPPTLTIQLLPKQPHAGQHLVIYLKASDNVAVARLELWIDNRYVLEEIGTTATYHWDIPSDDEAGQHLVVGRAYDVTGNVTTVDQDLIIAVPLPTATITPRPTATPSPSPSPTATPKPTASPTTPPTPIPAVSAYYETTLSLATYPYADYLWQETDVRYGIPLWRLDRATYEAARPTPTMQTYRALVIENEYLQLTILPELGGRLYRCVHKPTGQNIFYQNPVIKPSRWGALTPADHNWWLAAGGIEWALPVHEHGYEFGNPWNYSVQVTTQGTTVILWDSRAKDRLQFEVQITLPPQQAAFIVRPRLTNPLTGDASVQLWINAMLTLGSHTISPETEFVLPSGLVVVHSTGDTLLAAEEEVMSWPMYGGRDLSRYANWHQWLGVFVQQPEQNFVGAYNHATGLGVARIFPRQAAPGVKLFAFGSDFGDRGHYTDDDSQYFELWGGANRTFWPADDVILPAGGEITWQETWQPFAGIGGLTYANEAAALYLKRLAGGIDLGLSVSTPTQGWIRLTAGEGESEQVIWEQTVALSPDSPLRQQIAWPEGLAAEAKLKFQLTDHKGTVLLDYSTES